METHDEKIGIYEKEIKKLKWYFRLTLIIATFLSAPASILCVETLMRYKAQPQSARIFSSPISVGTLGYPAPESEIVGGNFYFCEASLKERRPSYTNFHLVLRQMERNQQNWKMVDGKPRLFKVTRLVPKGIVYKATRLNGILKLEAVGELPAEPNQPLQREPFQRLLTVPQTKSFG